MDPLDITAARENVGLTQLAEEGRAERAAAAEAEAKRAAAEKLEGPLSESLRGAQAIVHAARQQAAEALDALLTANAAYIQEGQEAAGQLTTAGYPNGSVHTTSVDGVPQVTIGDEDFEYFTGTEELIAILHVLRTGFRQPFDRDVGYYRDLARKMPPPFTGGPQKYIRTPDDRLPPGALPSTDGCTPNRGETPTA